jgi:hypothetical protein
MDSKTIQKYSKRNYSWLHKKAKEYFHKFIRLRDCDDYGNGRCIATGQPIKYGVNMDAGHFYSSNQYRALEFDEDNVNGQSRSDNYFTHKFAEYALNLEKKIGTEAYKELQLRMQQAKRVTFKQDRFLMIDIIETYKQKCKELAKDKMFKV